MPDTLYIVVPCYNEEEVLPETAARLTGKLESLRQRGKVSPESRLLLVDDGSRDQTWGILLGFRCQAHPEPGASACAAGRADDR